MSASTGKRSQAERRAHSIARLVDATIDSLAADGYARTTTSAICRSAQLSQGALFRHFASRVELIALATEEVSRRHLALLSEKLLAVRETRSADPIRALVLTMRSQARSPEHAAWHEVMVAARSDHELHALVAPTLQAFEQSLLQAVEEVLALPIQARGKERTRVGTIMLSLMHLFDSEAMTSAIYRNPRLEDDRADWLCDVLRNELDALYRVTAS